MYLQTRYVPGTRDAIRDVRKPRAGSHRGVARTGALRHPQYWTSRRAASRSARSGSTVLDGWMSRCGRTW